MQTFFPDSSKSSTRHSAAPETRWPRSPSLAAGLALLAGLLSSCAVQPPGTYSVDRSIMAKSQSSRVQHIVLHYTVSDRERALSLLSRGEVSSHYLVTDEEPPRVYQLVDEGRSAWHAGQSYWRGRTWLNATSIGIEIVNPGYVDRDGKTVWQPYTPSQIDTVTALVRDIARRHGVPPENIVGHSDIAPQRKQDPGPLFPWHRLAEEGLARWYRPDAVAARSLEFAQHGLPAIAWFQDQLARAGYEVPRHGQLDGATINVIRAFQMRYRPGDFSGIPDAETAAILATLP
jgi:N-acetylmuramoyl-L-alanine amidase